MSSAQKIGCHACGGEGEVLYLNEPDRVFGAPGAWTVVRCRNAECGLLWLTPSPTPDELRLAYAEYYTHGEQRRSRAYRVAAAAYSKFPAPSKAERHQSQKATWCRSR